MLSIIAVPAGLVSSTTDVMSGLFNDFSGIITLILGVVLGVFAISFLINALHR